MNPGGNTILVTGGGSGIGRGLAEELQKLGNHVIIAGRRRSVLDETTAANPGMSSMVFDIEQASGIRSFVPELLAQFPKLNVVINNAGIMRPEKLLEQSEDLADAEAIVTTNLLGPIRLIAALIPHFKQQQDATIINVSSGLAFVPLSATPTYCATKAAIHSYSQSLREQLKSTKIEVLEIIPPYVQTDLMDGAAKDPRAMPLKDFITETIALLTSQPTPPEIATERVKFLSQAVNRGEYEKVFGILNAQHFE